MTPLPHSLPPLQPWQLRIVEALEVQKEGRLEMPLLPWPDLLGTRKDSQRVAVRTERPAR